MDWYLITIGLALFALFVRVSTKGMLADRLAARRARTRLERYKAEGALAIVEAAVLAMDADADADAETPLDGSGDEAA